MTKKACRDRFTHQNMKDKPGAGKDYKRTTNYYCGNHGNMGNPKYNQEIDNGRIYDRARLMNKVKKAAKGGE